MIDKRYLRTLNVKPPGGWRFKDPDTGFEMEAQDFTTLVFRVETHRRYKGVSMENYPDEIEHQICSKIPKEWSQPTPRNKT